MKLFVLTPKGQQMGFFRHLKLRAEITKIEKRETSQRKNSNGKSTTLMARDLEI